MKRYMMELVGTFFLMYSIIMSASKMMLLPGLMLFGLMYVGGHISGGHFNPAITIAAMVRKAMNMIEGAYYILAQSVGAFLAVVLYFKLSCEPFDLMVPDGATFPLMMLEGLFTALFCLVVITVTVNPRFKTTIAYPSAIGVALMTVAALGFAVNPAVGIASILCGVWHQMGFSMPVLLVYVVGPALGGAASCFAYSFFNE